MATHEAQAVVDQIDTDYGHHVGAPGNSQATPKGTWCLGYREATHLAATRRRTGTRSSAYYHVPLAGWFASDGAAKRSR